jgi:hypothetical protein
MLVTKCIPQYIRLVAKAFSDGAYNNYYYRSLNHSWLKALLANNKQKLICTCIYQKRCFSTSKPNMRHDLSRSREAPGFERQT